MTTMVAMAEDDDDIVCNAGDSENMWCTGKTVGASAEQVQRINAH